MILQELSKCYDLMKESGKFNLPDFNSSVERVAFKLFINKDGLVEKVLDIREDKKVRIPTLVPLQRKRSSGISPYFLCDNCKYMFGYAFNKELGGYTDYSDYFNAARELHREILDGVDCDYANRIVVFFENKDENIAKALSLEEGIFKESIPIILCADDKFVYDDTQIRNAFERYNNSFDDSVKGTCLISGNEDVPIADIHDNIKGIWGASKSGAAIVSFNADSFTSYRKKKSYNASTSKTEMLKYTSALNGLLASSNNRSYMYDTTIAFWSDKPGSKEDELFDKFISDRSDDDKPEVVEYNHQGVDEIESVIEAINKCKKVNIDNLVWDESINLYILGLSAMKSRAVVRFWFKNSIKDFIRLANIHFEDTKLQRYNPNNKSVNKYGVKIYRVLGSIKPPGRDSKVPDILVNSLFKSMLTGSLYPISVYNQVLLRIRAEASEDTNPVNHTRASFIKGYLKRYYRLNNLKGKEEEVTVALNKDSKNVPYNLGRLFSLLERAQIASTSDNKNKDNKYKSSIRQKYLSSASLTPASIFPSLIKLTQHHIAKINKEKNTNFNYYDKLMGEILSNVDKFPTTLNNEEQGMFILGYYHQREDLFTVKETKEEN